jgi:phosphoglycolate phosphatase-like HAD superfamily hydrolase
VVYIDHDGTLTDSALEMEEYSDAVIQYNADTLGIGLDESEARLKLAKIQILEKPEIYGWKWGAEGMIVAPATSDHYLFNQVATDIMLTNLSRAKGTMKRRIKWLGGNGQYITNLFLACAPKLGTHYRPEARSFLIGLAKTGFEWAIVTNSDSAKVSKKLSTLGLPFEPRVIGNAKKYEVDRSWDGLVPIGPYKRFKGYPERGIELQRKSFYDTLLRETDKSLSNLLFVEDVGEFVAWLDWLSENNLEWIGARTALLMTPMTPIWEKDRYSGEHHTRFGSSSLLAILDWVTRQ